MRRFVWLTVTLLMVASGARAQPHVERAAIIVGSNAAPPGRQALHYAHEDARSLASVLSQVGEFPVRTVTTLLDPSPDALLARLDAEIARLRSARESLLFFYYSGHADMDALYPNGQPLRLAELRRRLGGTTVTVRLGIIDSCRGGGWTGAKGLKAAEPFDLGASLSLDNEGSVLIASSSGTEDAHESEALSGSFFTHHFTAGLRGAADKNRDARVSVSEAFEYAKALTIRDSALAAKSPQHPSFRMNLRGRQDLPLANLDQGNSWMKLKQKAGPLEVVHLRSGLVLLELHPGERELKVAVPPGRYLVRRRMEGRTFAKEYDVESNRVTHVAEAQLRLTGTERLHVKGNPSRGAGPHRSQYYLHGAVGAFNRLSYSFSETQVGRFAATEPNSLGSIAFTGTSSLGLEVSVPGRLGWRFGERLEWFPWIGAPYYVVLRPETKAAFAVGIGTGLDLWWSATPSDQVGFNVALNSVRDDGALGFTKDELRGWLALGYSRQLGPHVRLNLGLGYAQNLLQDGEAFPSADAGGKGLLGFGSIATNGALPRPLLEWRTTDTVSLGFDANAYVPLGGSPVGWSATIGLVWRFAQINTLFVE